MKTHSPRNPAYGARPCGSLTGTVGVIADVRQPQRKILRMGLQGVGGVAMRRGLLLEAET